MAGTKKWKNNDSRRGCADHPLYSRWSGMLNRCFNPKYDKFKYYGGRGIKVCRRWLSYDNFKEDMKPGFLPHLTLERKDVNGNYGPRNCIWIPKKDQLRNTRRSRLLTYRGETKPLLDWVSELGLKYRRVSKRLYSGWPVARAFEEKSHS